MPRKALSGHVWGWVIGPQYLAASQFAGREEESHSPIKNKGQEEVEKLKSENSILHKKVLLLQNEVLSFYDIVQFAAAVVFFFVHYLFLFGWPSI
jgi:hypothetical protein